MPKLDEARKVAANCLTQPVVQFLARTRITPNVITWLGFLLSVDAAVLVGIGNLFAAGLVVVIAGFFDMLDGALARHTNQASRFGGVLDSTLDRAAEAVLLLAIIIYYTLYTRDGSVAGVIMATIGILLAGIAMMGSFLVSYVRARMEAAGMECKVGLFTRTERVIVLALGLLLGRFSYALIAALAIIVFFSFFTAGQRLIEAWHQSRGRT